jgi:Cd2+/Zn2+-exporting ATPase
MDRKQKRKLYRIGAAAVLLVAAMLIPLDSWWRFALFLPAYFTVGWDVLWKACKNIVRGQVFDENFLMCLATIGAFCTGFFGKGEYPEAVFVMLFYQVGELFQDYAVGRSRKSISGLMELCPQTAYVETESGIEEMDPEDVQPGDILFVKPGEKIPLDGVVVEGESLLNTAALTGESLPRSVAPGDDVVSGCINQSAVLRIKATKAFEDSTAARILELVEEAASRKAKTEAFISRFAKYYTPVVVICAVLLAVIPSLVSGDWVTWVHQALIFLVVSCPCALVLSVPLSFFGGIGGASKKGILMKGGTFLESLSKVHTVVFDKTGTLTKGVFHVTAVHPEKLDTEQLLELAAAVESASDHPIAKSILEAWGGKDLRPVSQAQEVPGKGVVAQWQGKQVAVGNAALMEQVGAHWKPCHHAGTMVHIAVDGEYEGHLVISDEIKSGAAEALQALRKAGVSRLVMLTGDREETADSVGKQLGMDRVYSQLLPQDKVAMVETLLQDLPEERTLAFVGDGINDAPVLTRANVGVAMGAMGSDAAIEAADVVLMDDKLEKLPVALGIARKTMGIVRENIVFALGIKILVLLLSAVGLGTLWEAVFADVGVSVLAILNASRAMRAPKEKKAP